MTARATKAPSTPAATGRRKAAAGAGAKKPAASPRATGSRKPAAAKRPAKPKTPAKKKAAAKPAAKRARKPAKPKAPAKVESLLERGARVVGVTGSFGKRTLVEMPTTLAEELFPDGLADAAPLAVIEAAEHDIASIRQRDKALADSALAAAAVALARELSNPYNSATAKSMCAREMREHLDRLRELLPPERKADKVDDLAAARQARRAQAAGSAGT